MVLLISALARGLPPLLSHVSTPLLWLDQPLWRCSLRLCDVDVILSIQLESRNPANAMVQMPIHPYKSVPVIPP